jgi:prevent-host-death family protein
MRKVSITDLRQHLQSYLKQVREGEPIQITQHGKVVARLMPEHNAADTARHQLQHWRESARIGDVLSPTGADWEAGHGRL